MSVDGSAFRGRDASFDWAREWFGIVVGYALGLPDGSVYEENLITGTSRRSRSTRARGVSNAHQVSQLDASLSQTLQTNDNLKGGAVWQGLVYNLGVFAAELGDLCDTGFIWSLFESFLAEISIPLHRRPEFIAALRKIWSQSANGTSSSEASFNVNGDWFNPQIQINPFTNETRSQIIKIAVAGPNKIIAIVHVHRNNSSGEPSTQSNNYLNNGLGDIGIAKKYGY